MHKRVYKSMDRLYSYIDVVSSFGTFCRSGNLRISKHFKLLTVRDLQSRVEDG